MTDFRAKGTIMGLAGLTAVFGMGTGGAPPVSSPEIGREAVKPPRPRVVPMVGHTGLSGILRMVVAKEFNSNRTDRQTFWGRWMVFMIHPGTRSRPVKAAAGRGGQAVGC